METTIIKERPIIMQGESVRAILEGRKTQTRRVVKPQPDAGYKIGPCHWIDQGWAWHGVREDGGPDYCTCNQHPVACPYGYKGDRLWVRETWRIGAWHCDGRLAGSMAIDYAATPEITETPWVTIPDDWDGEKFNRYWIELSDELRAKGVPYDDEGMYHWEKGQAPLRWHSPIYMPRWASRLTLELLDVRVERVQEISHTDALAEGIHLNTYHLQQYGTTAAVHAYRELWDSINSKRPGCSWDDNPWVWVLTFKPVEAGQ